MEKWAARYLAFEDTVYGSFTSVGQVPRAGFRWAPSDEFVPFGEPAKSALAMRGPWLVEADPVGEGPWGWHDPRFQKGTVSRLPEAFAKLATADQFLAFANRHGFLGHRLILERRAGGFSRTMGESLAFWEHHARRVRILTTLARWVSKRDEDKLASVVHWLTNPIEVVIRPGAVLDRLEAEAKGERYVPVPADAERVVLPYAHSLAEAPWYWQLGRHNVNRREVLHDHRGKLRWRFGDPIQPAYYYVCEALNGEVEGHVNPRLMAFAAPELWRLYTVPDCLLSTMYLQLQMTATRGKVEHEAKPCERDGCTNFFSPSGNKRYCSPPCKRWGRSQRNMRYREGHPAAHDAAPAPSSTPITTPKPADGGGSPRTGQHKNPPSQAKFGPRRTPVDGIDRDS